MISEHNTVLITVYKDTINHKYNEDNNLTNICVDYSFAKEYYKEKINKLDYPTYSLFINNCTAEDTEDFYEYAKEHNKIISMEDM